METHSHIVKQVFDGSVKIDSAGAFEDIVRYFPDDPSVYRTFADLLSEKRSQDAAARAYRRATRLFLDLEMMLQAMVAKILEWRIAHPSHREAHAFFLALQGNIVPQCPLESFITEMAYPELMAFMMKLVRVRLPGGRLISKVGQQDSGLFLVVSGELQMTPFKLSSDHTYQEQLDATELMENDFFGDVFPLLEERPSHANVETMTRVELVKISKERLVQVCNKFPKVEERLKTLYTSHFPSGKKRSPRVPRKSARHKLPTKAKIKVYLGGPGSEPLVVEGFTEDISLGGTCMVFGEQANAPSSEHLIGNNVEVEIDLPKADTKVVVLGKVAWSKAQPDEKQQTAAGIAFKEMNIQDKEALEDFCYGSDGEQNLIWSLWESYVKS